MSCNFKIDESGTISVLTETGKPSQLFKEALEYYGDRQQAVDAVAISKTQDFEDVVVFQTEEPSLQTVLDYITTQNKTQSTLSAQQAQDLNNTLLSQQDLESFRQGLQNAYYPQGGLFAPTYSSLLNSGIYSAYEAQNIISDIDLQQRIKNAVEALNNTEIDESLSNIGDSLQKINEINSFGKLINLNPYITEQDALQVLAAPENELVFNDLAASLENPVNITYQQAQNYIRAQVLNDSGEIIPTTDTKTTILKGMKVPDVPQSLTTILNTPNSVLKNNPESSRILLKDIETNLVQQGLDLSTLSDREVDKAFLTVLDAFIINPVQNIDRFVDTYNIFFEVDTAPKTTVLNKENLPDRNYVQMQTNKPEGQILEELNLLKVKDGLYMKIRRQPLLNLYTALETYPNKYPDKVNPEEYVQQRSAELSNTLNAEEITLLKLILDIPLTTDTQIDIQQQANNEESFTGNTEYLTTEFIADFNAEALNQKQKNSPQWKNFYSFFEINQQGLALKYDDIITLNTLDNWIDEIKPSLANNLRQYSIISKQLPTIGSQVTDALTSRDTQRSMAVNYPYSVNKPQGESIRIDSDNILIKNSTQSFIRIADRVYEGIQAKGSMTLFTVLPMNMTGYSQYKIPQPKTQVNINDYNYLEKSSDTFIKEKNKLSKKEKEEIITNKYDC